MNRALTLVPALVAAILWNPVGAEISVREDANIGDSTATMLGVNHIGISVRDMDMMLDFYQQATDFELIRRERVENSATADALFAHEGVGYDVAVLKAPNMLLELRAFDHNRDLPDREMPAKGPGMTHTCFQSVIDKPGWDRFAAAGARALTRGGKPIDLGGYGVTYGYAYDPEGNMMELEQLDGPLLEKSGYDTTWQVIDADLWMSQVALVTHDLERLMGWYKEVLAFDPYRTGELKDNPRADEIADLTDLHILGGWFRISESSKVLELWQYVNPETKPFQGNRAVTDLGYSFSLEVADINAEYQRLSKLGVEFFGEPVDFSGFRQVYAKDVDGNVFSLRQILEGNSDLSVLVLEQRQGS